MTSAYQLLHLTSLTILLFSTAAAAEFTNSFTNLSYGSTVHLTWDASSIPPEAYPLFITAQLIDKGENDDSSNGNGNGGGGGAVTAYKMNITTSIDSSSSSNTNAFEWTGIPSPLRWLPEGLYQVELHRSVGSGSEEDGTATTFLAKSLFFAVAQPPYTSGSEEEPSTSSGDEPNPSDDSDDEHGSGGNKRLAYGLGFAIGIPSVVGLSLVSWCLWKRRRRVLDEKSEEERRARRRDFVID